MSNIAHQWRQPLSMISTVAKGTKNSKRVRMLEDEILVENMELINKNVNIFQKQ